MAGCESVDKERRSRFGSCEAYFEKVQARKNLPESLQETLNSAFAGIPVSSFPQVPCGRVIEIPAETSVSEAVKILSDSNILSAPVINPDPHTCLDWRDRYLGIIDYSSIILWVLDSAAPTASHSLANIPISAFSKRSPSSQPLTILKSFRYAPFLPVSAQSSMLSVLLLLSKYRLRNVPVIKSGEPDIKNYITQSALVHGLQGCTGRDWFDHISALPISDLGLPFMSPDQVISIDSDQLILEAFKRMRDNNIGGLPVVEGTNNKVVAKISMRDIKYLLLQPQLFSSFRQLTVRNFATKIATGGEEYGLAVTCRPHSTLGSVIDSLASRSVHRVYVVAGNENELYGVITLRDVISCFVSEPPNYFENCLGFSVKDMLNR